MSRSPRLTITYIRIPLPHRNSISSYTDCHRWCTCLAAIAACSYPTLELYSVSISFIWKVLKKKSEYYTQCNLIEPSRPIFLDTFLRDFSWIDCTLLYPFLFPTVSLKSIPYWLACGEIWAKGTDCFVNCSIIVWLWETWSLFNFSSTIASL